MENTGSEDIHINDANGDPAGKTNSTNDIATLSTKLHTVLDLVEDDEEDLPRGATAREDAPKESELIYKPDYALVDNEETLKDCLGKIRNSIKDDPMLALDCEGDKLSRHGKLHLMSVATSSKAFLVNVSALKSAPFEIGFREILEDKNIRKLMFDCREDADALFHQHHVNLDGVLDIQLLEVIKECHIAPKRIAERRCDRHHEVVKVRSLLECIEMHVSHKGMHKIKQRGEEIREKWGERPLSTEAKEYAATDAMACFQIFETLKPDEEELNRLEIASAIYVDLKRTKAVRTDDKFERNCYLPIDVVPEKGQTGFSGGNTACTKCFRYFPRDEFTKNQLNQRIQKCRTCKRVKQEIDTHENRMRNFERADEMNSFGDFSDSDECQDSDSW